MWWPCGDSTTECIDLIFTDQPNVVLESGTRSFLDPFCHHQMTHCRFNFKIPSPPPFTGKIWSYDKANVTLIRKSISDFPLENHFRINPDGNWQVNSSTEIVLDIMFNFIPNKMIKIIPSDPPWINNVLKEE